MPEPAETKQPYSEPTIWDERLYTIRGDLLDLKRHVTFLIDDLAFCGGQNAMDAFERFDHSVRETYSDVKRAQQANLKVAGRQFALHPRTALFTSLILGVVGGVLFTRARRMSS